MSVLDKHGHWGDISKNDKEGAGDIPLNNVQPVDNGGNPPHDDGMEHRVTALETRLDTILPTLATKTDIEGLRGAIQENNVSTSRWILATVIGLFVGFAGLFFAMSNASHAPASQAAPIFIQVPYPAPPAQAQPPAPKHPN